MLRTGGQSGHGGGMREAETEGREREEREGGGGRGGGSGDRRTSRKTGKRGKNERRRAAPATRLRTRTYSGRSRRAPPPASSSRIWLASASARCWSPWIRSRNRCLVASTVSSQLRLASARRSSARLRRAWSRTCMSLSEKMRGCSLSHGSVEVEGLHGFCGRGFSLLSGVGKTILALICTGLTERPGPTIFGSWKAVLPSYPGPSSSFVLRHCSGITLEGAMKDLIRFPANDFTSPTNPFATEEHMPPGQSTLSTLGEESPLDDTAETAAASGEAASTA